MSGCTSYPGACGVSSDISSSLLWWCLWFLCCCLLCSSLSFSCGACLFRGITFQFSNYVITTFSSTLIVALIVRSFFINAVSELFVVIVCYCYYYSSYFSCFVCGCILYILCAGLWMACLAYYSSINECRTKERCFADFLRLVQDNNNN